MGVPFRVAAAAVVAGIAALAFGRGNLHVYSWFREGPAWFEPASNAEPGLLERIRAELPPDAGAGWTRLPGCPRVPTFPSVMVGGGDRLYVATDRRLEALDVESGVWAEEPVPLPEPAGDGLAALFLGRDRVLVAPGGGSRTILDVRPATREVRRLPDSPDPVVRGGALVLGKGEVLLCPGETDTYYGLREGEPAWRDCGRVGGESPMDTALGRASGFLDRLGSAVYAWPNHHIHRLDLTTDAWKPGNWLAMKVMPVVEGGGVAADPSTASLYAVGGAYSRSVVQIVPRRNPESYFVRPRLPFPVTGVGDRVAVADKDGEPQLFVYAVAPANELACFPTRRFERIDENDDLADAGSAWHRLDVYGGGNGVRRWETRRWREIPGPTNEVLRNQGTLVVMGALEQDLFFLRRAYVRRVRPSTLEQTHYPGVNLGAWLGLGAAGVYDGERYLYVTTGRSDSFCRWPIPDVPPVGKLEGPQPPADETELEVLPPLPAKTGRGAALAAHGGTIYALRGGGTRDVFAYDVEGAAWRSLPSLPEEAPAVGGSEGGLHVARGGLFAVDGTGVWRLDLDGGEAWSLFATLPFAPDWDGGMTAADGERDLYVFRGVCSTRFGRLSFETGEFEELCPRLPDLVSAEGNRLAILTVEGQKRLFIHRGHNTNEVLWIALDELVPLDR